jgi:hypothetical protein
MHTFPEFVDIISYNQLYNGMLVDIIYGQYTACRIHCFVAQWIIWVFALLEQRSLLLRIEPYIQLCIFTDRMIFKVKIKKLFISCTRFFFDILILTNPFKDKAQTALFKDPIFTMQ